MFKQFYEDIDTLHRLLEGVWIPTDDGGEWKREGDIVTVSYRFEIEHGMFNILIPDVDFTGANFRVESDGA